MKEQVKRYLFILIGQFIGTVAFVTVLIPNKLVAVGLGGVATIIHELTGTSIQLLLILLCLPIILWAFFKYDRRQVYFATFCFSLFTFYIGIVQKIIPPFVTDPIIASVAAGILFGIGGGMVISQGIANGPEAIVGLYLKEKKDITVGKFFMILNTVIIFSSIIYGELTLIIYSLISTYIAGKITDYVIIGTKRYYVVTILSDEYLKVTDYIRKDLKRGVTFIQGLDTESVKKRMMLKTVVSKRELVSLRQYIQNLEDDSFVYATESASLIGGGFESV